MPEKFPLASRRVQASPKPPTSSFATSPGVTLTCVLDLFFVDSSLVLLSWNIPRHSPSSNCYLRSLLNLTSVAEIFKMAAAPPNTIYPQSHVGFDSITSQIEKKLLKRGFQFNVICVGKYLHDARSNCASGPTAVV